METTIYGFGGPWLVDSWIRIIASVRLTSSAKSVDNSIRERTLRRHIPCASSKLVPEMNVTPTVALYMRKMSDRAEQVDLRVNKRPYPEPQTPNLKPFHFQLPWR